MAFFQDEFYFCRNRFEFVNEVGIDLIYTHVHPEAIPDVWGRYAPRSRAVFNYPGYVDSEMVQAAGRFARPDAERDIDVGYRGRPLQPYMGSGSLEKVAIGERFKELAGATPLQADIDTSERVGSMATTGIGSSAAAAPCWAWSQGRPTSTSTTRSTATIVRAWPTGAP